MQCNACVILVGELVFGIWLMLAVWSCKKINVAYILGLAVVWVWVVICLGPWSAAKHFLS